MHFTDPETGLNTKKPEEFIRMYFEKPWQSGVKSFMVPIYVTSGKLIGSGIFYTKDCFIMSAKCTKENLKLKTELYENRSPAYRPHNFQIDYVSEPPEGVAVAKVSIIVSDKSFVDSNR